MPPLTIAFGRDQVALREVPAGVLVCRYRWRGRDRDLEERFVVDLPFHVVRDRVYDAMRATRDQ